MLQGRNQIGFAKPISSKKVLDYGTILHSYTSCDADKRLAYQGLKKPCAFVVLFDSACDHLADRQTNRTGFVRRDASEKSQQGGGSARGGRVPNSMGSFKFERGKLKKELDRARTMKKNEAPEPDRTCRHLFFGHCLLTRSPHYTKIVRLCSKRPECGYMPKADEVDHGAH